MPISSKLPAMGLTKHAIAAVLVVQNIAPALARDDGPTSAPYSAEAARPDGVLRRPSGNPLPSAGSEPLRDPSGKPFSRVKCSQSADDCFRQATKACGGSSYQVLDSESHAGGLVADALPGPVTWYGMTFRCGPSDGRMPSFPFRGQRYTSPPRPVVCHTIGSTVICN
jgi:hypothetical protein